MKVVKNNNPIHQKTLNEIKSDARWHLTRELNVLEAKLAAAQQKIELIDKHWDILENPLPPGFDMYYELSILAGLAAKHQYRK